MSGELLIEIYVLVLAVFVGFEVISKVPPTLHTPLMSGSNAISGIAIIGAILATNIDGNIGMWIKCNIRDYDSRCNISNWINAWDYKRNFRHDSDHFGHDKYSWRIYGYR